MAFIGVLIALFGAGLLFMIIHQTAKMLQLMRTPRSWYVRTMLLAAFAAAVMLGGVLMLTHRVWQGAAASRHSLAFGEEYEILGQVSTEDGESYAVLGRVHPAGEPRFYRLDQPLPPDATCVVLAASEGRKKRLVPCICGEDCPIKYR